MHSRHATTTTQEELDTLANKSTPCPPTTMPTAATHPTLQTTTEPDMPLPDAPATGIVATEEWRIVTGKAMQRKARVTEADKKWMAIQSNETVNNKNGR
jgi:hypothetical protein